MAIDWGSSNGAGNRVRRAALERRGNLTSTTMHDSAVSEKVFQTRADCQLNTTLEAKRKKL
jgi:hypothetical protein